MAKESTGSATEMYTKMNSKTAKVPTKEPANMSTGTHTKVK